MLVFFVIAVIEKHKAHHRIDRLTSIYYLLGLYFASPELIDVKFLYRQTDKFFAGWTIGSKPVGRNDVFTIRPKYYQQAENQQAENQQAEMTVRPIFFFIALLFTVFIRQNIMLSTNYFFLIKPYQVSCYNKLLYGYL